MALTAAPASTLLAQDTTSLPAHARVRVFAPSIDDNQRVIGTVEHSDSTGLQIRAANGMLWTIPRASIYTVEVSRGSMGKTRAALRGAKLSVALARRY